MVVFKWFSLFDDSYPHCLSVPEHLRAHILWLCTIQPLEYPRPSAGFSIMSLQQVGKTACQSASNAQAAALRHSRLVPQKRTLPNLWLASKRAALANGSEALRRPLSHHYAGLGVASPTVAKPVEHLPCFTCLKAFDPEGTKILGSHAGLLASTNTDLSFGNLHTNLQTH